MFLKRSCRHFAVLAFLTTLVLGCTNGSTDSIPDSPNEPIPFDADSVQINVLEASDYGGPELTNNGTEESGIQLRRFYAYTNPEHAQAELGALSFSDGGNGSALVDILTQEGGTLVALFLGLQNSTGVVDADIESVEYVDERLVITVNTQVLGSCTADSAFAAPFRILHIKATAPTVLFREVIQQCVEEEITNTTRISNITVDFLDNSTARINWVPPTISGDETRYDVINVDRELETYDGTNEPSITIANMVPGVIYARRIVPIDTNGVVLSQGTPIALMLNAPSGAFRGHAVRSDLEKLKTQLVGDGAKDCGEFTVRFHDDEMVSEISDCVSNALEEGNAFTADRVIIGEATSYESLISNGVGNSWLLIQSNSDVINTNDFAPDIKFGGSLTGQVCIQPAVSINGNFSQFTC